MSLAQSTLDLIHELGNLIQDQEEEEEDNDRTMEEQIRQVLLALNALVGSKLLDKALTLASRRGAIHEYCSTPSGRLLYRVKGDNNAEYKVLLTGFCNCRNFMMERAGTELPLCKHILGVHLAKKQGTCERKIITDEEWSELYV